MIEAHRLSKSYGTVKAVDDVSFRVDRGEVVGFLGPNGAGKSTTLRMLAGFLGPTAGHVRIAGHDMATESMKARAALGYMPETSPLYPEMRVGEYLTFRAELKLVPRRERKQAVRRALEDTRIDDVEDVMIGHLSKGYRQRVGLADALVARPPILILDEPTAGLDPNQIREVRELIRALGKEHAVLVSTHILPEVEATCTRALVIAKGRLVAQGGLDEIKKREARGGLRVRFRGDAGRARKAVRAVTGVSKTLIEGEALLLETAAGLDAGLVTEEVVAALVSAGLGVREVTPRLASLEQVFSELTGADGEEVAGPPSTSPASEPAATDEREGEGPEA